MQTDLERNSCMLCGEIWNSTNLIMTEFKGHQLRMCPECASDFDSYVKDKIIEELEEIKEEMWKTEPNGVSFELKNNISELIDEHIAELKGE